MPSPQVESAEKFKQAERDAAEARLAAAELIELQAEEDAQRADEEQAPIPLGVAPEEVPDGDGGFVPIVADLREPEPPEPDDSDDTPARRALSGKYVVLVLDTDAGAGDGWQVVAVPGKGAVVEPQLHEGAADSGRGSALDDERNAELAAEVRSDHKRFLFAGIPARSWTPSVMEPRVTKTIWRVVA